MPYLAAVCASISIHALREEGDYLDALNSAAKNQFLSTPSARRATALDELTTGRKGNFYPRPPRGGRRPRWQQQ